MADKFTTACPACSTRYECDSSLMSGNTTCQKCSTPFVMGWDRGRMNVPQMIKERYWLEEKLDSVGFCILFGLIMLLTFPLGPIILAIHWGFWFTQNER